MDLSSEPSSDEARIMERQLYRPGQTPPTPKPPTAARAQTTVASAAKRPSGPANSKPSRVKHLLAILMLGIVGYYLLYGTPSQRRKILVTLGAAAWLLFLGGVSYCIFLPDPVKEIQGAFADMKNLTPEQRREKFREIRGLMRDLTPHQKLELGRERQLKERAALAEFMKLSPEEQVAKLKKSILEEQERRKQRDARRAASGGNGSGRGGRGGNGQAGGGRGGNGGGANGGGTNGGRGNGAAGAGNANANANANGGTGGSDNGGSGGGRGGRSGQDSHVRQRKRLDNSDPEDRAMHNYARQMNQVVRQQMGLPPGGGRGLGIPGMGGGPGGPGGMGGGPGGPGGRGRGR